MNRTSTNPVLALEKCFSFHDLISVRTSKHRKQAIEQIKFNLASWTSNPEFEKMRSSALDLAIVATINFVPMKWQDVDNIAKVVLDALKRTPGDNRFLFSDDHQIIRLLIIKQLANSVAGYQTDALTISFRVHDGTKQMNLIESKSI